MPTHTPTHSPTFNPNIDNFGPDGAIHVPFPVNCHPQPVLPGHTHFPDMMMPRNFIHNTGGLHW